MSRSPSFSVRLLPCWIIFILFRRSAIKRKELLTNTTQEVPFLHIPLLCSPLIPYICTCSSIPTRPSENFCRKLFRPEFLLQVQLLPISSPARFYDRVDFSTIKNYSPPTNDLHGTVINIINDLFEKEKNRYLLLTISLLILLHVYISRGDNFVQELSKIDMLKDINCAQRSLHSDVVFSFVQSNPGLNGQGN